MLQDEIKYSQVNDSNINLLKSLNSILFPVSYNESFYNDVLNTYPKHLSLLAYHNNNLIAAICCREEDDRVYIMTFGVIETYRRFKIGSKLLQKIIAQIELYNDLELSRVCLHVHVLNNVAIGFYLNNGFRREEYIEGYYKRNVGVEPPDAYLLVRDLINKN